MGPSELVSTNARTFVTNEYIRQIEFKTITIGCIQANYDSISWAHNCLSKA